MSTDTPHKNTKLTENIHSFEQLILSIVQLMALAGLTYMALSYGYTGATNLVAQANKAQLDRIERKLDATLKHDGIDPTQYNAPPATK